MGITESRKVLDELARAVVEEDEAVFTRYMGKAKQRLVSDETDQT